MAPPYDNVMTQVRKIFSVKIQSVTRAALSLQTSAIVLRAMGPDCRLVHTLIHTGYRSGVFHQQRTELSSPEYRAIICWKLILRKIIRVVVRSITSHNDNGGPDGCYPRYLSSDSRVSLLFLFRTNYFQVSSLRH